MDIIDEANELAQEFVAREIGRARMENRRRECLPEATECEDCGREIPAARRKAVVGCTRCVACQEKWEAMRG